MWTLANHARVPANLREQFKKWGNCKDEFTDNGGWSHQIYVREARRMISDYVMTQHNCQGREKVEDSVGLAAYTMDSHNTQRYVDAKGHVRNEGDVQVGGFPPYPIAYRSLVPKQSECENLLVPVCLAASHIAYGSIRMEPVFMVLGQSAATAAVQSLEGDQAVQKIDVAKLQEKLKADKQILEWTGPSKAPGLDPKKMDGIVVDDADAKKEGEWLPSSSIGGYVGHAYLHDNAEGRGSKSVAFTVPIKTAGKYEVRVYFTPNPNRSTKVPVTIKSHGSAKSVVINQQKASSGKGYESVGTFEFEKEAVVRISNEGANGHVIADAVQLIPVK
jgi:hypothetical protein